MKKKMNYWKVMMSGAALFAIVALISSCNKEENPNDPPTGNASAQELKCDYFKQDRILTDNPDAPVDYIIDCNLSINKYKVEIEPGVVIEMKQGTSILIENDGLLTAKGTSDKPIVIRGVERERGYWVGILFRTANPLNQLSYVMLSDAGASKFSNGYIGGVMVYSGSALKMNNTTITNCRGNGFDSHLFSKDLTLNNNIFKDNESPAHIAPGDINAFNGTNKCAGNDNDFVSVQVYTNTIGTATWHKLDVKYKLINMALNDNLSIQANALLTIQPGVEIEFPAKGYLSTGDDGALKAIGTANDPIIFTGTAKAPKAWKGIRINSKSPENQIQHAIIEYSGFGEPGANVHLWYNSMLNIDNVTFKNIAGCGVNPKLFHDQTHNPNLTVGSNIVVNENGCVLGEWN